MYKAIFDFAKSHITRRCFPDYMVISLLTSQHSSFTPRRVLTIQSALNILTPNFGFIMENVKVFVTEVDFSMYSCGQKGLDTP